MTYFLLPSPFISIHCRVLLMFFDLVCFDSKIEHKSSLDNWFAWCWIDQPLKVARTP